MGHVAVTWAYQAVAPSSSSKAVLVALASFADADGSCFPGHQSIADMTQLSRATVLRHLHHLEHAGLVSRERRHDARGYRTSDRYQLNMGQTMIVRTGLGRNEPSRQDAYKAENLVGAVSSLSCNDASPRLHGATVMVSESLEEPSDTPPLRRRASPASMSSTSCTRNGRIARRRRRGGTRSHVRVLRPTRSWLGLGATRNTSGGNARTCGT